MTNTDDFIWRLVKGCIQLSLVPDINNTINMVPVDQVARCTALSAIDIQADIYPVLHVAAQPPVRFNDLLLSLARYGYKVQQIEYLTWRTKLEEHVLDVQDNALFPLLHFVLDDLPTSTKAPEKGAEEAAGKGGNLVGKLNNLVTTDLNNVVDGRDFLFISACYFCGQVRRG